ncbi:MAG: hypothetical protein WCO63_07505 [Bacteroidota bacterium]
MQQSFQGINPVIEEWKGQEIVDFQEELLIKVNARLSEKWFYTHIKSNYKALPRIDVLNLLSQYAAYKNWDDFVYHNSDVKTPLTPLANKTGNKYFYLVPAIAIVIMGVFIFLFMSINTREYKFSFYDTDTKEAIKNCRIEITVLGENESPQNYLCDTLGNFLIRTDNSKIKMIVQSPYYIRDTVERIMKKFNRNEKVGLHANEYALMLNYFSQMKVADWQKRRTGLDKLLDDKVVIYQVYHDKSQAGMQLFNKWEFIDKLTIPTNSLKNIEILETRSIAEKIMILKFRVKEQGL